MMIKQTREVKNDLEKLFFEKTGRNFNVFYKKYFDKLVWKIHRLNIDILDAEGIANDSFMHSLEKIEQYNPEYHYSTWLFTIGKMKAFHFKNQSKKTILVDCSTNSDADDSASATMQHYLNNKIDTYNQDIDTQEMISLKYYETLKEINKLAPKFKTIVELYNIHGKSYNDIVNILGSEIHKDEDQRLQTVKNRLHLGRNKIEKSLNGKFKHIMENY